MARDLESASEAVKEGISLPGEETSPKDANSSAPSTEQVAQPSTTDDKVASTETSNGATEQVKKESFEEKLFKNPGFKKMQTERDQLRKELEDARKERQQFLKALEGMKAPAKEAVVDEKEQAAKELRRLLGVDTLLEDIKTLKERNSDFTQRETDQAFDKEEERIVTAATKFGLNPHEVKAECQAWLDAHPYFSKVDIQPGFYDLAFKALYFDKSSELAQKAAQLEQIKQRDKLRQANTETPANASTDKGVTKPSSMRERLQDMIKEGGGAVSI